VPTSKPPTAHATFELLSLQTNEMPGNPSVEIPPSNQPAHTSQSFRNCRTSAATAALASANTCAASQRRWHRRLDAHFALRPRVTSGKCHPAWARRSHRTRLQSQHTSAARKQRREYKIRPCDDSQLAARMERHLSKTLETAGVNTGNAHAESPDSTMVAAAIRTPIDPTLRA